MYINVQSAEVQKELFHQEIARLKLDAKEAKKELIAMDLKELKTEDLGSKTLKLYTRLTFFPDVEVIQHLSRGGYSEKALRWFIPIEELIQLLNEIEASGKIIFWWHMIFEAVKSIVFAMTLREIMDFAGLLSDRKGYKNDTLLTERIRDALKRKKEVGTYLAKRKQSKIPVVEQKFAEELLGSEITPGQPLIELLKTMSNGHSYLKNGCKDLITQMFQCYPGVSKSEKYRLLFPLLRLITKHHRLVSDEDLEKNYPSSKTLKAYKAQLITDTFLR